MKLSEAINQIEMLSGDAIIRTKIMNEDPITTSQASGLWPNISEEELREESQKFLISTMEHIILDPEVMTPTKIIEISWLSGFVVGWFWTQHKDEE